MFLERLLPPATRPLLWQSVTKTLPAFSSRRVRGGRVAPSVMCFVGCCAYRKETKWILCTTLSVSRSTKRCWHRSPENLAIRRLNCSLSWLSCAVVVRRLSLSLTSTQVNLTGQNVLGAKCGTTSFSVPHKQTFLLPRLWSHPLQAIMKT